MYTYAFTNACVYLSVCVNCLVLYMCVGGRLVAESSYMSVYALANSCARNGSVLDNYGHLEWRNG